MLALSREGGVIMDAKLHFKCPNGLLSIVLYDNTGVLESIQLTV